MFLVPYNRLSEEQKAVVRRGSRHAGDLFIEGPPGSGKTLISLYLLKTMIASQSLELLLVIYNHSLYGYLSTALKELSLTDNITIVTKDKYFWDLAKSFDIHISHDQYHQPYEAKYHSILTRLSLTTIGKQFDVAIIDEIQDLSDIEWQLLNRVSHKIVALGDFDQSIYQSDLTKQTVTSNASVETLTDIFRFHRNIAKVAQLFSKSSEKLEDKVSRVEQKEVQLIDIEKYDELDTIAEILASIKNQQERVAVISHDKDKLNQLRCFLATKGIKTAYYYQNHDLRNHDFNKTEPLLITSHSAKGLEFEHVILFGFEKTDSGVQRMRQQGKLSDILYVSLTRTNTNLYIIRHANTIPELLDIKVQQNEMEISLDEIF